MLTLIYVNAACLQKLSIFHIFACVYTFSLVHHVKNIKIGEKCEHKHAKFMAISLNNKYGSVNFRILKVIPLISFE